MAAEHCSNTKRCSRCLRERDRSEFFKCADCKDGLRGECKECVAEKQKLYNEKNAEQIARRKKQTYAAKRGEILARHAEYHKANAVRIRENVKRWAKENPERLAQTRKAYQEANRDALLKKKAEYRSANRDLVREQSRQWYAENKDRLKPYRKAARAMRRGVPGKITAAEIREIISLQKERCAVCGVKIMKGSWHLDHITPISRGGTNNKQNIQALCPPCNLSKSARDPTEFMQSRGFLL